MANNPYKNKVVYNGQTLIDLTGDTVTPQTLLSGYTAHDASGAVITGEAVQSSIVVSETTDEHGGTVKNITTSEVVNLESKTITSNGTYNPSDDECDGYSEVIVNVASSAPNLQSKSATPTETAQTITADTGYDGLSSVSVGAISPTYVGSEIPRRDETSLTASGKTVTVSSGYYAEQETKDINSGSLAAPTATYDDSNPGNIRLVNSVATAGYIGNTAYSSGVLVSSILPTKAAATITPTESSQTAVEQYKWTTGAVTVAAIPSDYVGSDIVERDSTDLTASGATVTVPAGYYDEAASKSITTTTQATPVVTFDGSTGTIIATSTQSEGYVAAGTKTGTKSLAVVNESTITPTESIQTVGTNAYINGTLRVAAIPSDYVGSDITTDPTPTVSGRTVTIPEGYYTEDTTAQVTTGSATTPATTVPANPSISVNATTGLITATASATKSVTPTVSAGYVSSGTAGTVTVSGSNTEQLSTQAGATITPTESEQTAVAAGKYTTGAVKVGAISSTYVGSGITSRSSSSLTASGATVTAPAGYYASAATKTISTGTVTAPSSISGTSATVSTGTNTITLSKTVSVTPNVSTAGYISSGTAGNSSVSLTASVTTKGATTYNTSTNNQTIASGTYLTGTQTISGVTVSGLSAENIANGVTVKVGDSNDDDRIASVTGTLSFVTYRTGTSVPASSLGANGDIYLKVVN